MTKIGVTFSFSRYGLSIPKAKTALDYYRANIKTSDEWLSKDSNIPIFVDTNVLLKLYKISKENRKAMLAFFEKNKDRIYICGQVGQEYLKHRCAEIKHYATTIGDLQKEVRSLIDKLKGSQIKHSLDSLCNNDIVQDDMPETRSLLSDIKELYQKTILTIDKSDCFDKLNDSISSEGESLISDFQYEFSDPIMDIVSSLNHLEGLSPDEEAFTQKLYGNLLQEYKNNNSIEDYAFPGSGDSKKLKYGRPAHGDLIIFHEMLRHVKDSNTDSIFITLDVTKGDWLRRDGQPFIHYIYSIFNLTGHMIYICSEKDFPISFDSISGDKDKDEHEDDDIEEIEDCEIDDNADSSRVSQAGFQQSENINTLQNDLKISTETQNKNTEVLSPTPASVRRYTSSAFRDIDPKSFISELKMALDWAKNYGAGYVNKSLFVHKILRNHHYDSRSAFRVMSKLLNERKIISRKEIHNGRQMDCLDIMTSDLIPTEQ